MAGPKLNNNAYYAYNYYRKKHNFSDAQAAGIVGNLMAESSFNTNARNKGDGRDGSDSIGIGQWNGDRASGLHSFAAQRGTDVADLDTQLDYYVHELNGPERRAGDMIRNAGDVSAATTGAIAYERPAGFSWDNPRNGHNYALRLSYANQLMGNPDAAAQATAQTQVASAEPEKEVKFPALKEAGESIGKAMGGLGFSGTGKDGDPRKLWGMELEGEDGLLADLGGFTNAFAQQDQSPQMVAQPRGQTAPVEVSFDIASSAPSIIEEEELKKRRGGLAGFGGFTRRA